MIQVFGRMLFTRVVFGTKLGRNGEEGHDRGVVNTIHLHLVQYLQRVAQRLGHIAKHVVHLLSGFKPLLFGVEHTGGVVEVFARGQTQ